MQKKRTWGRLTKRFQDGIHAEIKISSFQSDRKILYNMTSRKSQSCTQMNCRLVTGRQWLESDFHILLYFTVFSS